MNRSWGTLVSLAVVSMTLGGIPPRTALPPPPPAPVEKQRGLPPVPAAPREPPEASSSTAVLSQSARRADDLATDRLKRVRQLGAKQRQFREARRRIQGMEGDRRELADRLILSDFGFHQMTGHANDLSDTVEQLRRQLVMLESILLAQLRFVPAPASSSAGQLFHRAVRLSAQGKKEEAIQEYQEVLRQDPFLAAAWENLGIEFLRTGRYPQAGEAFAHALSLDPDNPLLHYNLGVLAEEFLGEPSQALLHYRTFLVLAPKDPDAPRVREWVRQLSKSK